MGAGDSPQVIGRYAIYGKVASGGMASVHLGRQVGGAGFSRTVAIKRLHPHLAEDPEFQSTMIDEARLASRIHHPNVVPTLDVVASEGELLLVMEYVRGESLARLMRTETTGGRRVPLPIASAVVLGALHGLHAAHEATSDRGAPLGIVHRDVSPQNILVGVDGMVRVIDFGVAKAAGRLQTTQDGAIKGKIAYMAPEQLASRGVTRTADVYAMGVVLWELLTGRRLFQADSNPALVGLVMAGAKEPPSLHAPDLPAGLDALVMRALHPDPVDRFATALDMAERLRQVLPPAFQTDVGTWCERAARESLAKRGVLLVEVESSSGVGAARGSVPDVARVAGDSTPNVVDDDAVPANDDPPQVATQPSSLSLETPSARPSMAPRMRSRRATLAAVLGAGGGLLLAGVGALWLVGREPAPTQASGVEGARLAGDLPSAAPVITTPTPTTPTTPTPAPSVASTSVWPAATSALSPRPTGTVATVAPKATASLPASPGPAPTTPMPISPAAPAPARRANCNPSFTYDANGEKHFKPECFAH